VWPWSWDVRPSPSAMYLAGPRGCRYASGGRCPQSALAVDCAPGLCDGEQNRYTLHSFRRFAAKRWLESGLNIRQVQLLLHHEDLQTTMVYLDYDLDEIARAAESVTFGLRGPARSGG